MTNTALLAADETRLHALSEGDVRAVLEQHNPKAQAGSVRAMAKIIAAVSDVLAELPASKQRELARAKGQLRTALLQATRSGTRDRVSVQTAGKVEKSQGTGIGELLSLEEGRARLDAYVSAKPLESWAGPVAGAGEIEGQLGIPRSTLSNWQKRGAVIGLLRGERKLAYPLEQFVDARPLEGICDVLKVAPDARAAWLWLRQPHGALGDRAPLDVLRTAGARAKVTQAAARDFI